MVQHCFSHISHSDTAKVWINCGICSTYRQKMPLKSSSSTSKVKKKVVASPYFKPNRNSYKTERINLKTTTFHSQKEVQKEDALIPVPDILDYDLRVLFVGINGGLTSSKKGHHFAGATNHFWPCLSGSGQLSLHNILVGFGY